MTPVRTLHKARLHVARRARLSFPEPFFWTTSDIERLTEDYDSNYRGHLHARALDALNALRPRFVSPLRVTLGSITHASLMLWTGSTSSAMRYTARIRLVESWQQCSERRCIWGSWMIDGKGGSVEWRWKQSNFVEAEVAEAAQSDLQARRRLGESRGLPERLRAGRGTGGDGGAARRVRAGCAQEAAWAADHYALLRPLQAAIQRPFRCMDRSPDGSDRRTEGRTTTKQDRCTPHRSCKRCVQPRLRSPPDHLRRPSRHDRRPLVRRDPPE